MQVVPTLVQLGISSVTLILSFYILGLPLARIKTAGSIEKSLFSVMIGFCLSIPLTLIVCFNVQPEKRLTALYLVLSIIVVIISIDKIYKYRLSLRKKWLEICAPLGALLYVTSSVHLPSTRLGNWAGIYSGNGDLAYYSALAKLLNNSPTDSLGWIQGTSMRQDLFGNWGYGGGGGAASLSFSSLILHQTVLNSILPVFISYCVILIIGNKLILKYFHLPRRTSLLISAISVLNVYVFYLASQGFTQMFISMIGVQLLIILACQAINDPPRKWVMSLPILFISAVSSCIQYLCYPILGAPFLIFYVIGLLCILIASKRKGENFYLPGIMSAILGSFIPLVIWPHRLMTIVDQIPMFTSGVPGWKYMIAKPTSMFLPTAMGSSWKLIDFLLFFVFLTLIFSTTKKLEPKVRFLVSGFVVVGLILALGFGFRDGFDAYTAWKGSYFIAPISLSIALAGLVLSNSRHQIVSVRLLKVGLVLGFAIVSASNLEAVKNRSIPIAKFPINELTKMVNIGESTGKTTLALGPLDQLWAIYATDRIVTPISPNIHVAQKYSDLETNDTLITFADDAETKNFCKGLNLENFREVSHGNWYKVLYAVKPIRIACE